MRKILASGVLTMAIAGGGCGSSPIEPLPPPASDGPGAPPPAAVAVLNFIRIGTSALVLKAVGESGQLTVEAYFSNGTSLDRTAEAQWTSQDTGVATVVPGGSVTAVGFGVTRIEASFDGKRSTVDVLITPPNTLAFTGRVREPGAGSLSGVRVLEMGSNNSTITDQNGEFRFFGLQTARFRVDRDGFEVVEIEVAPGQLSNPNIPRVFTDIPLQKIVRFDAGASRSQLSIAPNDVAYTAGPGRCQPCKLIRVAPGRTGILRVTVAWPGMSNALHIWMDGTRFVPTGLSTSAQAAVTQSGDVLVYVGWSLPQGESTAPDYVTFGITTSIDDQ